VATEPAAAGVKRMVAVMAVLALIGVLPGGATTLNAGLFEAPKSSDAGDKLSVLPVAGGETAVTFMVTVTTGLFGSSLPMRSRTAALTGCVGAKRTVRSTCAPAATLNGKVGETMENIGRATRLSLANSTWVTRSAAFPVFATVTFKSLVCPTFTEPYSRAPGPTEIAPVAGAAPLPDTATAIAADPESLVEMSSAAETGPVMAGA
jgi:hypothetical protein